MIKLFTWYKNSKCNTFEQQLNPPPPFKYHLNFNCTFYPTSLFTLSLGIEPSYYVPVQKRVDRGLLMFPSRNKGGRWSVIQRYGNENLLKSSKGGESGKCGGGNVCLSSCEWIGSWNHITPQILRSSGE